MEEIKVNVSYIIGEKVYLVTDPDQQERMVTAIVLRQGGIIYEVSYGVTANTHSACELTTEKNYGIS